MTGVVVMAAMLWLLLNFVYAPSCGRFSCSYQPSWLPQASADTGDCPDSLSGAATDATWAANRIESLGGNLTSGYFYDADGSRLDFDSTKGTDSDRALKVGRSIGVFPQSGRPSVVDHVEVKVAAAMRDSGETVGVLVINNPGGPCYRDELGNVGSMSCLAIVPRLLPDHAVLTVWWPDRGGGMPHRQRFTGGQT